MYNRNIDIAILSKTTHLEDIISKVNVSGDALLSIKTVHSFVQIDTNSVDILIYDIEDTLDTIQTSSTSSLIICINKLQVANAIKSIETIEDIWLKPFDASMIHFQFQKLIERVILKRQHRLNQIYLDTVINNVPDLIWFKNLNGIHLKVNNEFCYTVGKTKQDIEGYDHYHIWNIDKQEYENSEYVCLDTDSIVIQSRRPGAFDEKVEGQRGMRQLKTYKSPIIDDRGELIGTVGVAHDVTDLKNMNTALELILNTMPFAIMVKDYNECVLNVNPKFEEFFQIRKETIIGKPYYIYEASTTNDSNPPNLLFYDPGNEIHLQHHDTEIILEIHKEAIYDFFENFVGTLHIYREVTAERNFEKQLKLLAYTDQLTGLFTRRYLYDFIDKSQIAPNINLLYCDLDNFKLINDTYGHHCGDEMLKTIGTVFQDIYPNDICVRMGGDEFLVVIIGNFSAAKLKEQANILLKTIKTRFSRFPTTRQLSVSMGIATFGVDSPIQLDELLKKTDIALYKAKSNGKKQYVVYTPALESERNVL